MASSTASAEQLRTRVSCRCGEVTLPTSSDISQHKLSTLLSATHTSRCSPSRRSVMVTPSGWPVTWPPEVWLVPLRCFSSTLSTTLGKCSAKLLPKLPNILAVPVSQTMPSRPRVEEHVNSTVWSTSTERRLLPMVSLVSTVVSVLPSLVSWSTVVCTSACTTPSSLFSWSDLSRVTSWPPSCSDGLSPLVLVSLLTHSTPSVVV